MLNQRTIISAYVLGFVVLALELAIFGTYSRFNRDLAYVVDLVLFVLIGLGSLAWLYLIHKSFKKSVLGSLLLLPLVVAALFVGLFSSIAHSCYSTGSSCI